MLRDFYSRLSPGLKLLFVGVIFWLLGTIPLLIYMFLARVSGTAQTGPGVVGVFGFAANVAALVLVVAGLVKWMREQKRDQSSENAPPGK
jgi:uncharacterized membrane protein YdbT with pleckstrin-like domain